jgi:ABC-type multidrug transport system fused ATPase/permease subunit
MGNPNATDEQIWEAIHTVSADEVIAHLEKGLDTDVGEGGDLLSTGEKQLISFARAVLADPRILILDEATASLDAESEREIQEELDKLAQGRTTLIVAHRFSTIRNAHRILVFDAGRIVGDGPHEELYANCPLYKELYDRQGV